MVKGGFIVTGVCLSCSHFAHVAMRTSRALDVSAKLLFLTIVVSCMIYQLFAIFQLYLSYKVDGKLLIEIPSVIQTHTVSLCLGHQNMIDYDLVDSYGPINVTKSGEAITAVKVKQSDMIKAMPASDRLLESYSIRQPDTTQIIEGNASTADDHFTVSKYTMASYVCYRIMPKKVKAENVPSIAMAVIHPGTIFAVKLNMRYFGNISYFSIIAAR